MLFAFAAAGPPLTDELRRSESRRSREVVFRERPELSNLPFRQILVLERVEPLRAGISCFARPAFAAGPRQYWEYCMRLFSEIQKSQELLKKNVIIFNHPP